MTGRRRSAWRTIGGVAVLLLGCWLVSLALVVVWSRGDEAGPADAIVVLGAAQWNGRPSPVLRARLEHARELWNKKHALWLVVTGGVGAGDTTSEAVVSRRFLVQRGVPQQQILLEGHGRTTEQSMRGVADMLRRKGLSRVLLVSDPFHMLRLDIVAWGLGLTPKSSPTRSSPISQNTPQNVAYILAESVKVPFTAVAAVAARLRGAVAR